LTFIKLAHFQANILITKGVPGTLPHKAVAHTDCC